MKKLKYKLLGKTNYKVSPIGLGTVEIGQPYGIKTSHFPSNKEVLSLTQKAISLGINFFDTARSYGVAEERIGRLGLAEKYNVIVATKCAAFLGKGQDLAKDDLRKKIYSDVNLSLKLLNLKTLPLLQFHGGSVDQINRGDLINIAQDLKKENKIKYIGISTRSSDASLAAINSGAFDTVQIAYSILDQRESNEVLPLAKKKNVGIIVRSVFLKGALTPAVSFLPPELSLLKEYSNKANKIANKLNISLPVLAMRFVLSNPAVSTALIGTYNPKELQIAVDAALAGPLTNDILKELRSLAVDNIHQIDPFYWPPIGN